MLHDGGERDGERAGELADRHCLVALELGDQGAPCGVGKRGEGAVERGGLILNHMVKCREIANLCQSTPFLPLPEWRKRPESLTGSGVLPMVRRGLPRPVVKGRASPQLQATMDALP
jgi:hypothetical protein